MATALLFLSLPCAAKDYDYLHKELNQKDAAGYGSNNYWNGSGDSKDEGVRNAMRALNRLASLDIGGAFHYGYKGYGNYINSQRMDDLDARAWKNKDAMNSAAPALLSGSSGTSGEASARESRSTITRSHNLSDMDQSFLYRGETGEVAAEFEKRSGMSREEFFDHLAAAEASGLSWDDPHVVAKAEQRLHAFVARIPNQEYRANLEKAQTMLSMAKKMSLLEEGVAFYKKMRWGEDGGPQLAANGAGGKSPNAALAGRRLQEENSRALASLDPKVEFPASLSSKPENSAPTLRKDQMGMYLGLEGTHEDELKDLMVGAEDNIFLLVSKRYRKLTPMLLGKAIVLDVK